MEKKGVAKLEELYNYNATDPTVSYDPLEIPSDEEYYKVLPKPSLKERILKLFKLD